MTDLDKLDALCATEIMGWDLSKKTIDLFWKPTINIAQAWECFQQLGLTINIYGSKNSENYHVWFSEKHYGQGESANTLPLAIVLAALKSKGIAVE